MPRNKYRVSPPDQRRWNGRTYASKAEMRRAQELHGLKDAGVYLEVVDQPSLWLGVPENTYRPDFLVIAPGEAYYEDVKGAETTAFKRIKKLWASYGRLPLRIVKAKGKRFETVEVIPGVGVRIETLNGGDA